MKHWKGTRPTSQKGWAELGPRSDERRTSIVPPSGNNSVSEIPNALLKTATSNVQGLAEEKLVEITTHMGHHNIQLLCAQETRQKQAYIYDFNGYVILRSGAEGEAQSFTGVGFIISESLWKRIRSYKQVSDRIVRIKIRMEE
eukprot:7544842-Pyramimonas_sp.AAC.1